MTIIPWRGGRRSREGARAVEPGRRSRRRKLGLDALEGRWAASTWAGVVDGLWSSAANWDVPPAAGADLVFPLGASNLANTNDLEPGLGFVSLSIGGSGYLIGGNPIALSGPILASYDSGGSQVTLPIQLASTMTATVAGADASLELGGVISGFGGLIKEGAGTLALTADNSYFGVTTVNAGTLQINGVQTLQGVVVNAGGTLGGTGRIGSLSSTGGTVKPGTAGPGALTVEGGLQLDAGSTFSVALNGLEAGSAYSQVVTAGPVALGGATLDVSLGFQPDGQAAFRVIDNTGADPIGGTFAGLAEGATFTVSSQTFRVSYAGGDGNDVVLTRVIDTATTLDASPPSAVFGQTVTLTATVTAGGTEPTGSVEFFAGATSLGTATLDSGTAVLQTTALPVGDSAVTAQYLGEGGFNASTSPAVNVTVAQAQTATALTATPDSAVFGQDVTLTAAVTAVTPGSGTPSGLVEFFNGPQSLGLAPLSAGTAELTTAALPVGLNDVSARYLGDDDFAASDSPAAAVTVAQADTTTTLGATPNPAPEGEPVTITATVNVVGPGSGTPTGAVEFFRNGTSLGTAPLVGNVAEIEASDLPLTDNVITARYEGDASFNPSLSEPLTVAVRLGSTTTVAAEPSSSTFGQSVRLTATVAPGSGGPDVPAGTVEFLAGATSLGTAALDNGVAVLDTTAIPAGDQTITASYLGSDDFAPSSATTSVTVAKARTTTAVTAEPDSPVFGQGVTLTATVAVSGAGGGTPAGTVEFFAGATSLGTATLDNGVATLATTVLPVGTSAVTARYAGNDDFEESTSDALSVTVAQAATTTSLTASPTSSVFGQSVALTATVGVVSPGAGVPAGSVEFFHGATSLGTATLVGTTATLSTTSLPAGADAITARYLGNDRFAASASDAVTVAVAQAASTTVLSTSPNPSTAGAAVTLTAAVTGSGGGAPTGSVEFLNGATSLGTATVVNGQASLSTSSLPVGANAITARYLGDAGHQGSTSTAVTQQVVAVATTTTLTASNTNPGASEPVTLTAVVTAATGGLTPTGTVQFLASGASLGTATLVNGQAALTLDSLPAGLFSVTAQYQGDASASASTSAPLTLTVGTPNEIYVTELYLDLLGRDPSPQELAVFAGLLDRGRSREWVASRLLNSRQARELAVQDAYQTFLGRDASQAEINRTLATAARYRTTIQAVVLGSREYYHNAGGTVVDYLTALGQDLLNREFDPFERPLLANQIQRGVPLIRVVTGVERSQTGRMAAIQASFERILARPASEREVWDFLRMDGGKLSTSRLQVILYATPEFYELVTGVAPTRTRRARPR